MSVSISSNVSYDSVYSKLRDIYMSYCNESITPLLPTHDKYVKTITPLINVNKPNDPNSPIINELIDDYKQALYYIGKCHENVPKFKRYLDTRMFSNEIAYHTREFGYIPKSMKWSFQKLIEIAFSASSFRTMCAKAEIAVFMYYVMLTRLIRNDSKQQTNDNDNIKSNESTNQTDKQDDKQQTNTTEQDDSIKQTETNNDDFHTYNTSTSTGTYSKIVEHDDSLVVETPEIDENMKLILGAFSYAITKANEHPRNEVKMAVYIWELSTFISAFANLNTNFENEFGLPSHHIFQSTHRYHSIANFGDFDITDRIISQFNLQNLTEDETKFISHLSKVPKCLTDLDFNNDVWFYIPTNSDTKEKCTNCFNECITKSFEVLDETKDYRKFSYELCKMNKYELDFILQKEERYAECCEFYFRNTDELDEFKKTLTIPEQFDKTNLYIIAMMQKEVKKRDKIEIEYKLELVKYE